MIGQPVHFPRLNSGLLAATLAGLFFCAPVLGQDIPAGVSWDWQLQAPLDLAVDVDLLVLDPDEVTAPQITALVARGVTPVCYVSVGTFEDWRNDASAFPDAVLGHAYDGWPGERFLDIRALDQLLPIMAARFRHCAEMGFVAIEADNIDLHINDTGFAVGGAVVARYFRELAELAHGIGLTIAQKNAPDLTAELSQYADFAMAENCLQDGWCSAFTIYVDTDRAVLAAEYTRVRPDRCTRADALGLSVIFKRRNLTAWRRLCP